MADELVSPTVFDRDRIALRTLRWKAGTHGQHVGGGSKSVPKPAAPTHQINPQNHGIKMGDTVTAPHSSGAALPGKVTAVNGNKITVQHQDGTKSTHPAQNVTPTLPHPGDYYVKNGKQVVGITSAPAHGGKVAPATGAPAHGVAPATGGPAGSNYPNANKGPYG